MNAPEDPNPAASHEALARPKPPDLREFSPRAILCGLFVAALIVFGYNYFRQNELAWLVLKPWQRYVIIACGIGIAFLLIGGFPLLGDRLTPLGVIAG